MTPFVVAAFKDRVAADAAVERLRASRPADARGPRRHARPTS